MSFFADTHNHCIIIATMVLEDFSLSLASHDYDKLWKPLVHKMGQYGTQSAYACTRNLWMKNGFNSDDGGFMGWEYSTEFSAAWEISEESSP